MYHTTLPYLSENEMLAPKKILYETFFSSLTPKCSGHALCLFLKFGQAIVVTVLMLNFLK